MIREDAIRLWLWRGLVFGTLTIVPFAFGYVAATLVGLWALPFCLGFGGTFGWKISRWWGRVELGPPGH